MKRVSILLLGVLLCFNAFSHPWKPSHYLIIDTDGGIDDIKAITMLLASPDVRILAITITSGTLDAPMAFIKVKSLLNSFFHEGIPVGINRRFSYKSSISSMAHEIKWGDESEINPQIAPDSFELISEILAAEKTKISFICLGGLTTAFASLSEVPDFKNQVKEVIWSSDGLNNVKDYNRNIDLKAVSGIMNEDIVVRAVKGFGSDQLFTEELIKEISLINNSYSRTIHRFLTSDNARNHTYSYNGNDEMIPLYLHFPEMFKNSVADSYVESTPEEIILLRNAALKILKGETVDKNQVMKIFPSDPSLYFDDIGPSVKEIVERYGMDEWTSGVIANELHRHLGVFAIIGVKMGIRARQYFNTGVDEFYVTSFAGSMPPLSCMNDGLQVSTGATPGHGLLNVINDSPLIPSAEFSYLNRKIRLTLKPDIAQRITGELKEINFIYGLDSNIYWELVRKNSIRYWLDLDRNEIFTIEEIK